MNYLLVNSIKRATITQQFSKLLFALTAKYHFFISNKISLKHSRNLKFWHNNIYL